jgi:Flp pilus assembly protein TadB
MGNQSPQIFAIVVITIIGVGSGDHVSDAVGRRRAAHGDRDVPRFGAIIDFGQDVRMNVDHDRRRRTPNLRLTDLSRFANKRPSGGGVGSLLSRPRFDSHVAGILGMLIATGLAMEHWIALPVAVVVFVVGLVIRMRSEEKLLRAACGEEFEAYARRVPAVIPGFY